MLFRVRLNAMGLSELYLVESAALISGSQHSVAITKRYHNKKLVRHTVIQSNVRLHTKH